MLTFATKHNIFKQFMTIKHLFFAAAAMIATSATAWADNPIRVNQVGYETVGQKVAVIDKEAWQDVYTITDADGATVWRGRGQGQGFSPFSKKKRQKVNFTMLLMPGHYTFHAGQYSQPIVIRENAFHEVARASMKSFYLQRTGQPILSQFAGVYARPAAHPDDKVIVHESAASSSRPAGTVISSPGGWYDAGDFNKYVVNSAFSIGIMLAAYENCSNHADTLNLNIPESGNGVSDMLDEIMVNLKWMQTMQDPEDGGVYHKLTTPYFEGFIMPAEARQQRYVVMKSTAATLDFAAVMAQAARIYGRLPQYKEWAATALEQARKAYAWAKANPKVYYHQNEMNEKFKPAITTGEYGDEKLDDEWMWANTELRLSTGEKQYKTSIRFKFFAAPTWSDVEILAAYSTINAKGDKNLEQELINNATWRQSLIATSGLYSPFGNFDYDFAWGSNSSAAGMGVIMMYAYKLTQDKKFLNAAIDCADYLMGRNATGYCFITGYGTQQVMHPHQRISYADGIEKPLPGFLVGGPNPGHEDKAQVTSYPSDHADESYTDNWESYASNEIAINWNADLAAFLIWLDAETGKFTRNM